MPVPRPTLSRCSPASNAKLEQYHGNLQRAAVELAKDWRTDKMLRHLEALLLVADQNQTYLISGAGRRDRAGDRHCRHRQRRALRPGGGRSAGRAYRACRRAQIAEEAMKIAGQMCIYTNENLTIEEI